MLTLRSLQLKGRSQGLDAASPDDPERVDRYVREFHADVEVTDRVPWETFERFFPAGYVACLVERRRDVRPDARARAPGRGSGSS